MSDEASYSFHLHLHPGGAEMPEKHRKRRLIEKSDYTPTHVMFRFRVFRLILQIPCDVLYKYDNTIEYSLSPNLTWYQRLLIYVLSLLPSTAVVPVQHCCKACFKLEPPQQLVSSSLLTRLLLKRAASNFAHTSYACKLPPKPRPLWQGSHYKQVLQISLSPSWNGIKVASTVSLLHWLAYQAECLICSLT